MKRSGRKDSGAPDLWALIHAERAALAADLTTLTPEQWQTPSLCRAWTVEQVVAHLTAGASLNQRQWLSSMAAARFRADLHNQRQLEKHRGATPEQTLARFRTVLNSRTAPSSHTAAYLGEVVVHGQDIRRPLGLPYAPRTEVLTPVAEFFAARDFIVPSRTISAEMQLRASDGPFVSGYGYLATGPTLALIMSMAGRDAYLHELTGPGAATLQARVLRGGRG